MWVFLCTALGLYAYFKRINLLAIIAIAVSTGVWLAVKWPCKRSGRAANS